ncbi:MAG: SPFH domain-containing protein [Phycisphaerales bacterium]
MKADYLSYQHATHRSLLGLAIQIGLGLILLVYSVYARDHAAQTAAYFMLLGAPIWLTLALVFDQHRRERIEAVEAEAFAASDFAAASVFERQADDLRVAHKRLRSMHRFLVPAMSLLVAALLISVGIWRLRGGRAVWDTFAATPHRGWAIALGLGAAFVGFLFARYMSGMAKQKAWENLRAGAAYAAGTALLGLALAVGHLVHALGPDIILRVLLVAFPVVLVALGAEFIIWFLLDLYRPRKPGEFPRPAFESRALGFLAAPDKIAESIGEAINYQFGYDVTDSWVYRLLARSVFRILIPVALIVLWGMTALAVVRPHERAMVLRFGKLDREIAPGLHLKWPWPIEWLEVPQYPVKGIDGRFTYGTPTATGLRTLDVGTSGAHADKPILWTNEHAQEVYFIVQPGDASAEAPLGMVAPGAARPARSGIGVAVVAAEVPLHYTVEDVSLYEELAPPEMRDDLLRAVAQRAVMQRLSSMTAGEVLSVRRTQVQGELRRAVEQEFAALNPDPVTRRARGAGVKVLFVGVDGVHPPRETASMFEKVVEARHKYQTKLKRQEGEAVRTLTGAAGSVELAHTITGELDKLEDMRKSRTTPDALKEQELRIVTLIQQAGGRAASLIQEASAERWTRHMAERTRLADYQGHQASYKAAPGVFRASMYLDAMRSALSESRVFITDGKTRLDLKFDFQDKDVASDIIGSQNPIAN